MGVAERAKLVSELELDDRTSRGVNSAIANVNRLDKRIQRIGSHASRGFSNAARNTERIVVGVGAATVGLVAGAVKVAGDFEAQLNTINTIARQTPAELKRTGDQIRGLAKATGTPLEELTSGYYDLLSAGIAASKAQGVLTTANTLAIGGLATTAETVDLLTSALNAYGYDASKATKLSDQFAVSIERGKVTAAEIAESYSNVAPLAAQLNVENKELAAGYARITAGGATAGEATTQMASALTQLLKKSSGLKGLEKQTGRNYAAIAGRKGLAAAYEQLRKDADKAGVPLAEIITRKEALLYLLQTTGPNFDKYNADLRAVGEGAGTAAEQMSERQKGLNFQMARLKALTKDAGITIGSKLIPKLIPLFEKLTGWLDTHQGDIEKFGDDLAKGFEEAAKWISQIDWGSLAAGLKIAAASGKLLIDAFLKAPPWLQGFLITGFAATKFTGGALGSIVGELGKGLVKGVLGMNAGVVNINAGVVNGGGVPGAAGGVAGAARAGLTGLQKVFLVGEAVGLALLVNEVRTGISNASTAQAQAIHSGLQEFSAKAPTSADLRNGLRGVESGIEAIKSNPLLVLVQGEALAELQKMRGELQAAVTAREEREAGKDTITAVESMKGKLQTATDLVGKKVDTSSAREREKMENVRTATVTAGNQARQAGQLDANATRTAGYGIQTAIRNNRPITHVSVRVSATTVEKTVNVQTRYGPSGGSRSEANENDHR